MATGIKEIARKLGLSANTVSNILNRGLAEKYSAATRAKVVRTAEKMGYRPARAAQSMRAGKSRMIAFAAVNVTASGQLENHGILPFINGLSHGLTRAGHHLVLVELSEISADGKMEIPSILQQRFFDGLVVHYGAPRELAAWAQRSELPVLWWDCGPGGKHASLWRDEKAVTEGLMQRLYDLGHRRIAFMVGERGWAHYRAGGAVHYSFAARYEGYETFMRNHGLEAIPLEGYLAEALAPALSGQGVTAALCMGNIPPSLFLAAARAGRSIPDDLCVATFDFDPRLDAGGFRVGGIAYDRFATGMTAAEFILGQLESGGKASPSRAVTGDYLEGDSIRPPSGANIQ